jgi:UDP-N-acetylmuramate dehydrogenase
MAIIEQNVPLAPLTSLQIGGTSRFFAVARSVADLREALLFARKEQVPFALLGGGTNLLVSDSGFDGITIRLQLAGVELSGGRVRAEAGVDLTALVQRTPEWGLSGVESLAGIPGLVGGAVRGNAGAYGCCIGEVTESVFALDTVTLDTVTLPRDACSFSYRSSRFKTEGRFVVISALLELAPGDPREIRSRIDATLAKRSARNLQCEKSVGSFFMNPVVTDPELIRRFEADQQVACRECRIPAGWLIDQAGLRNTRVGAAMVSAQHANYLINTGNATAKEMVELAQLVKRSVLAAMGVRLQEEVSLIGFGDAQRPTVDPTAPIPAPPASGEV